MMPTSKKVKKKKSKVIGFPSRPGNHRAPELSHALPRAQTQKYSVAAVYAVSATIPRLSPFNHS